MDNIQINRKQLIAEISFQDKVLKAEAERVFKENWFDPAVAEMKDEWEKHPVTQEIAAGPGAPNVSNTLEGSFRNKGGDTTPNLWGFIGFNASSLTPEAALAPIKERLDPDNPDGPKVKYDGMDKDKLAFRFKVTAPDTEKIYRDDRTGFFWAKAISWVYRIEHGIPGMTHFLNKTDSRASRSSGGIQVEGDLRRGSFKPVSYLSSIFNNFLRNVVGRKTNGRGL